MHNQGLFLLQIYNSYGINFKENKIISTLYHKNQYLWIMNSLSGVGGVFLYVYY